MPTVEQLLEQNIEVNRAILGLLGQGVDRAFFSKEIDLTTAHTDYEVPVGNFRWVQFWCDGTPIGITVGIGTQDNKVSLEKFSTAPVAWGSKVYVTNDVRAGRSKLLLVFSRTAPLESYLGGQISLVEHAARLGSISTFDRRGGIAWYDDFEYGLSRWTPQYSARLAISSDSPRSGLLSAKLTTLATGIILPQLIYRYFPSVPSSGRIGVEFSFTLDGDVTVHLVLRKYDGTTYYEGGIALNQDADEIRYSTGATSSQFTATLKALPSLGAGTKWYHTMKLVIDIANNKYIRLMLDDTETDMSSYSMSYDTSATKPNIEVSIEVRNKNASVAGENNIYVDDVIFTIDEP